MPTAAQAKPTTIHPGSAPLRAVLTAGHSSTRVRTQITIAVVAMTSPRIRSRMARRLVEPPETCAFIADEASSRRVVDRNSRRSVRGRSPWVLLLFSYDLVHLTSVVTPGATDVDLVATEPVRPGADALTTGDT